MRSVKQESRGIDADHLRICVLFLQHGQIGAIAATGVEYAPWLYLHQFQPLTHATRDFAAQEIRFGDTFRCSE